MSLADLWRGASAVPRRFLADRRRRNGVMYAISSVLARGGSVFLAPFYTRRLSLAEYGDLSLAQTMVGLIPTFVSAGLLAAVSRFYYEGRNAAEGLQRAGVVARWIAALGIGSTLVLQLLALALGRGVGLASVHHLTCVAWAACGALLSGIPLVLLRAGQKAAQASALQLVDFTVGMSGALALVVWKDRGVSGALEALAIAGFVNVVVALAFVVRVIPGPLLQDDLRKALRFSVPYVPHFAANQFILISDRWFLKTFGFVDALGVYSLASQLASPVTVLVLAWNEAISPKLGEDLRAGGLAKISNEERQTVRSYLWVALGGSAAVCVSAPLFVMLFGKSFGGALTLLPLLCVVLVVETLYYPYSNFLFFANQTAAIPRITFAAGLAGALASLVLVAPFGLAGAIAGRALGGATRSALAYYFARRILKESSRVG